MATKILKTIREGTHHGYMLDEPLPFAPLLDVFRNMSFFFFFKTS